MLNLTDTETARRSFGDRIFCGQLCLLLYAYFDLCFFSTVSITISKILLYVVIIYLFFVINSVMISGVWYFLLYCKGNDGDY